MNYFDAKNYYYDLSTNITTKTDNQTSSKLANISSGADLFVITATNYTNDSTKTFAINLTANGTTASYIESFLMQGVELQNYQRLIGNYTSQNILFDVVNDWNNGTVNWSLANPSETGSGPITGQVNLTNNERLAVIISKSYIQQDTQQAVVTANISRYTPVITDLFGVHPLEILTLQTLYQSFPTATTEMVVKNNLNTSQTFAWNLTGPTAAVTGTNTTNITNSTVFVIISAAYNTGVDPITASVNASIYSDTEKGVVVLT